MISYHNAVESLMFSKLTLRTMQTLVALIYFLQRFCIDIHNWPYQVFLVILATF